MHIYFVVHVILHLDANFFYLFICDLFIFIIYIYIFIFIKSQPPYQVEKRRWVCQGLVCLKRELLQDHFPSKFQDVKFKNLKFKHEIFMRIDMKHSYFSNYFIICLPSIFSAVEIIIELFVVCQYIIHVCA